MSDEHPFEFESPALDPKPDDAPAAPRRRRARGRSVKPTPAATTTPNRAQRIASPLVSPTFYYLVGFLLTAGAIVCLYNPTFGAAQKMWPHEAFTPFTWNADTYLLICLGVLALVYLVATFMRRGVGRAVLVTLASLLAFVTFERAGALPYFLLPALLAVLAGSLVGGPHVGGGWRPHPLFWMSLVLLGVLLFIPWAQGNEYQSTAFDTVQAYIDAPEEAAWQAGPYAIKASDSSLAQRALSLLVPSVACLVFLAGLLAFLGCCVAWLRWIAGTLLVLLVLGTTVALYLKGAGGTPPGDLSSWQWGLRHWGAQWPPNHLAYALPLAAAVAEFVRGRRP